MAQKEEKSTEDVTLAGLISEEADISQGCLAAIHTPSRRWGLCHACDHAWWPMEGHDLQSPLRGLHWAPSPFATLELFWLLGHALLDKRSRAEQESGRQHGMHALRP